MFENIISFFKNMKKSEKNNTNNSKEAAKERLHLVLMQDRANVSADFLDLMKQEIIDVIKKYIEVDESAIDVRVKENKKVEEEKEIIEEAKQIIAETQVEKTKEEIKSESKKNEE